MKVPTQSGCLAERQHWASTYLLPVLSLAQRWPQEVPPPQVCYRGGYGAQAGKQGEEQAGREGLMWSGEGVWGRGGASSGSKTIITLQ